MVGAGALVLEGMKVPPFSLVVGSPAQAGSAICLCLGGGNGFLKARYGIVVTTHSTVQAKDHAVPSREEDLSVYRNCVHETAMSCADDADGSAGLPTHA